MSLLKITKSFFEILWVPRCVACNQELNSNYNNTENEESHFFCDICALSLIKIKTPCCSICSLLFETGHNDHLCSDCLIHPPPFLKIHASFSYGGAIAKAITRFKYAPASFLHKQLGQLLFLNIKSIGIASTIIVPVPLHNRRLASRGFNQSALLANYVSKKLKIPLNTSLLYRKTDNPAQAGLSKAKRLISLHGSFVAANTNIIKNSRILVVDDVVTTTATVRAVSRVLLEAGALEIEILCLARTI